LLIVGARRSQAVNEPLRGLEERDVLAVAAAVRDGVRGCRDTLALWMDHADSAPVEDAVARLAAGLLRTVAASEARPAGPATTLAVRLLLVALVEEIGRPHVIVPN
jgi:hypothetical protein